MPAASCTVYALTIGANAGASVPGLATMPASSPDGAAAAAGAPAQAPKTDSAATPSSTIGSGSGVELIVPPRADWTRATTAATATTTCM